MLSTPKVFAPYEDLAWIEGELVLNSGDAENPVVLITDEDFPQFIGQQLSIPLKRFGLKALPLQNNDMPLQGVEDMTKLDYLHEPSILDNLRR